MSVRWRTPVHTDWRRPLEEHESPHSTYVDSARYRVICRSCPWFFVRLGSSPQDLRLMGRQHLQNMSGPCD